MYAGDKPQTIASNVEDHLLRTLAAVPAGSTVLDAACGPGDRAVALAQLGFRIYACDSDKGNVARTRARLARLPDTHADNRVLLRHPEAPSFPDSMFNWVILVDTTRGQFAAANLLSALRRATVPGGWLYIAVEVDSGGDVSDLVDQLDGAAIETSWSPAQGHIVHDGEATRWLQTIYRRVEVGTPP